MDHEFLNFINENKDEISKLNRKMKQVHDDFRREVIKLSAIIREKYDQDDIRQWEWRHLPDLFDISVTDITLGNKDLCIHTIIDSSSWSFEIFDRNQKNSSDSLATILENGNISYDIVNGRFKLQKTFGLEESREVIADETLSLLRMLKSGLS